jgi:phospholipase C
MARLPLFLAALSLLFASESLAAGNPLKQSRPSGPKQSPTEHVVVLMLENRAFDHMLGHLEKTNPKIDGLNGKETNPVDPKDPSKGTVKVSFDQVSTLGYNPGHSVGETELELWGGRTPVYPNPMNGFVYEMELSDKLRPFARDIMRCYNSTTVPVISTLAKDFAVFDKMYSSVGPPHLPPFVWRICFHFRCSSPSLLVR